MSKIVFLIIFFLLTYISAWATVYDYKYLENILEKISIETGSSPELDAIEQLIENPLCLKDVTIQEFLKIPGFTTSEARNILSIVKNDTVINFFQLFALVDLNDEQKYLLTLCTSFEKSWRETGKKNLYIRTRTKNYLNDVRGFEQNLFKGDNLDIYNRVNAYYDKYSFGLLTDKDAGEVHFADHYSAYFSGEHNDFKFLLGDYYIETGLGNLLWKSFPVGKSAEVIYPALQKGAGIREYRSSIDYRYFRGLALQKDFKIFKCPVNFLIWSSIADRAGTLDTSCNTITAVYRGGYYRTESEISKIGAFNEILLGGNFEWKYEFISLGYTAMHLSYDKKILSESKYAFYGKEGTMMSLYSYIDLSNISIGAELSSDANGNAGLKAGTQMKFGDIELAFNLRSFTPNFRSQYGYSFGESSAPNNEYGIYSGIKYKRFEKVKLSAYADFYGSYDETYYVPEPTKGIDLFIQADWKISNTASSLFRISAENKTDAINITDNYKKTFQKEIYRTRVEYENQLHKKFGIRFRMEANYICFRNIIADEKGAAGFVEINWQPIHFLNSGLRFSPFSTNSFESVIYQYEMAMPGYMTTVPLYDDGFRSFAFIKISFFQNMDLWIRYSITKKNNVESLGSGYLEIWGDKDQRLMFQLDCRL